MKYKIIQVIKPKELKDYFWINNYAETIKGYYVLNAFSEDYIKLNWLQRYIKTFDEDYMAKHQPIIITKKEDYKENEWINVDITPYIKDNVPIASTYIIKEEM